MISVLIPAYNEEGNIIELNKKLLNTLKDYKYELIYIDDGSTDKTLEKIKQINDNNIKYISFSRNFGKDAAIYAGLKKASGEFICIIDSDLQQNPKYIINMYNYLKENNNIDQVAMVMKDRLKENIIKRNLKKLFYKICNKLSDIKLVDGASDFRMFRKNVKDAILSLNEVNRFTKGIFSWIGFNTYYMYYQVEKRYSHSIKPLYISTIIGIIASFISLIYMLEIIFKTLIMGKDTPGYASLIVVVLFLGGIELIFIGILGTYIGKTYIESKNRPIYIEKETKGFDNEIL